MFGVQPLDRQLLRLLDEAPALDRQAPPPHNDPPRRSDDAYHFHQFRTGTADEWYIEWWYFNFVDAASGQSGIVVFQVTNPASRHLPTSFATVLAAWYPGGRMRTERFPFSDFRASTLEADVRITQRNRIEVVDDNTYRLVAQVEDLQLDLTFTQRARPVWLARGSRGPVAWEEAWWLAYMPVAEVAGEVSVGRETFAVAGPGYHDHNWGKWLWHSRSFFWVSFANPTSGLGLDCGVGFGFNPVYEAVLSRPEGDLRFVPAGPARPSEFERRELWRFPGRVELSLAEVGGAHRLEVVWEVLDTAVVARVPLVVFEHRAAVRGRLLDGGGQVVLEFAEEGFSEWTVTHG